MNTVETTEVDVPAETTTRGNRVKVRVYPNPRATMTPEEWMAMATAHRQQMFEKYGFMPDSALEVAEDRRRDD
jgi:hypothetical protein